MEKELRKELVKLAKKYGYEVLDSCAYCGHSNETLPAPTPGQEEECIFITLLRKV